MRQKIFEAEKTRIQRLAEMANMNLDLDIALSFWQHGRGCKDC